MHPYKVNRTVIFGGKEYEPGAPIRFDLEEPGHDEARRDLLARLAIEDDPIFAENILLREQAAAAQADAHFRYADPRSVADLGAGLGEVRARVLGLADREMVPDTRIATPPAPVDQAASLAEPVPPLTPPAAPLAPPPSPAPAAEPVPLGKMKKPELIEQAAREQVEIPKDASVQEIIAAIEAKRAAA
ncbi:hypothetical protein I6G65_15945 [Sphingomonas paucimobilis]|uniref:DNA, contig: SP630 n=1 Tax=Sphingomonas paucimobilis NBRC 13935 TaxID=1219050 RepID=A0A0C9NCX2_SPHPI|nr:hypothetical protein [Sphingomonas paucimobilis]QPS15784.1 hypothetical protein I6G65_15945 [Sphingomonas paucimobilis]GAN14147.1 hypothetical protein SP6_30_02880 [Sphingomonas paucimobilis NBRC 13935]SUJ08145.1 Uncharacterised protein [Sphingomonas paucimobilis]